MDSSKGTNRKGAIWKMWERCKSFQKAKSLPLNLEVAPAAGCFPIYVGPEKVRFVIKTEHVNHRLFKILLEEAKSEYGYCHNGVLMLPCQVDHFEDVLILMKLEIATTSNSSYHLLTPPRLIAAQ